MERREFEPRKLFVGGLPPSVVAPDGLRAHFSTYGRVLGARVVVAHDGVGHGFGFVEFEDEEGALRALEPRENAAHNAFFGQRIDVRKAQRKQGNRYVRTQISTSYKNADTKKVFVGGLRDKVTKDDLSDYFEKFGKITDAVVMYDKTTRMPRGFGFVTFDSQEAADEVLKNSFHFLKGTKVETKNAEPRDQNGRYHDSVFLEPSCPWSPAYSYGGVYSPHNLYNGPFFIPYLYPYGPGLMMNYGYTTNQNSASNDTPMMAMQATPMMYPYYRRSNRYDASSQSDSKLKANQQSSDITASSSLKSDPVSDSKLESNQQRVEIIASPSFKLDTVKLDSNQQRIDITANTSSELDIASDSKIEENQQSTDLSASDTMKPHTNLL